MVVRSRQHTQKMIDNGLRKRTDEQREVDLIETAALYVQGWRQDQIAQYISERRPYKLTQTQISYDIRAIHDRWVHAQLINMDEAKARELSKIDKVEQAAWEAWEKSLQDDIVTESTRIEDNAAAVRNPKGTTYTRGKVTKTAKGGLGNPKYLEIVLKCVGERCRVLGVYAPDKIDISWRDEAVKAGFDPEELQNNLVQQFVSAAARPAVGSKGDTGRLDQEPDPD